jgi:RimJ/RimL family protein N-acetyltransferase
MTDDVKFRVQHMLHQEQLLFNRLNYFLIGTAFLMTAVATVVASRADCTSLFYPYFANMAFILFATGYCIAWLFTVINYVNAQAVHRCWLDYDHQIPFRDFVTDAWTYKNWGFVLGQMAGILWDILQSFVGRARRYALHSSPHVWIIPAFFVIVWLVTWYLVMPPLSIVYPWEYFRIGITILPLVVLLIELAVGLRMRNVHSSLKRMPIKREDIIDGGQGLYLLHPYCKDDPVLAGRWPSITESRAQLAPEFTWCTPEYSEESDKLWIAERETAWRTGQVFDFAILEKPNQFVGSCGIKVGGIYHKCGSVSYWIRTSKSGKGAATSALKLLLGFGFKHLGLRWIEIEANLRNSAGLKVLQKVDRELQCFRMTRRVNSHGDMMTVYSVDSKSYTAAISRTSAARH